MTPPHGPSGSPQRLVILRFAPWMGFENRHPHDLMWPMNALGAAGQALRSGWEAHIIDLHVEDYERQLCLERVLARRPALVLMDTMTPTMAEARLLAATLRRRRPELPLWVAGQHASALPEDLVYEGSPFDGAVAGEYEVAIPSLLDGRTDFEGAVRWDSAAQGIVRHGGPLAAMDLDALAAVEPRGLLLDRYQMRSMHVPSFRKQRWGYLQTSRGCPYDCTFCSPTLRQSFGHRWRGHSAERVVDDMRRLHRDHRLTAFYLLDDLFSFDRQRVLDVCQGLISGGPAVSWLVQTRADCLDPEVLAAMRRAGCKGVKIGVEAGSDRILTSLRKGYDRAEILAAARAVKRSGIPLTACFILGNPGETLEDIQQTVQLAMDIRADMIQVAFHTPYPGSETYRIYQQSVSDPSLLNHYDIQAANLSQVSTERMEREQRHLYLRYYLDPRVFFTYLRRRGIYRVTARDEWGLLVNTLRFWQLQKHVTTQPGVAPRPVVDR
jgi:anaerobic magnesium-protoporphyrin IX monomethyl ester cyclase